MTSQIGFQNSKFALFTNDVETQSIWFNSLRDETGMNVLTEGMPRLLEIYSKYNIRSTFFFTGYIAKKFPQVVKMVQPYKHEIASHGLTHEVDQAFDVLPYDKQVLHLRESKKILEDISGQEVISFRAPALRLGKLTGHALQHTGFKIDSSVASQRFDMFLSFGGVKKLKWLTSPRKPYRTQPGNLFKKGTGAIIEVPLTAMILPYLSTTMRIFPTITRLQRRLLNLESSLTAKPIVFDIHPNEFLDESTEKRTIQRRSSNYVAYLLKDLLRSALKTKNLGDTAQILYRDQIEFFLKEEYQFVTMREYVQRSPL